MFFVSADSKGDRRKTVESRKFKAERGKIRRAKHRDAEYAEVRSGDGFRERGGASCGVGGDHRRW